MWMKYIGSAILLLVALSYCYQHEQRALQMKRRMGAWVTLLTDIRTHIACFGTPLSDILPRVDPSVLSVLEIQDLSGGTEAVLERCRSDAPHLPGGSGEHLMRLAEELGTVWRQEQIQRLDYYIEMLEKQRTAFCETMGGEVRIRRALCLLGTVGGILLVW
jgi:hypothetical protein